jgi:hypothetical protein
MEGTSIKEASEKLSVRPESVERARTIVTRGAPELAHEVETGNVSVRAAADVVLQLVRVRNAQDFQTMATAILLGNLRRGLE